MKLLKIDESLGFFFDSSGQYSSIEKINKDDLLRLVNLALMEDSVELDAYDETKLKNLAHQVIYKSIVRKLSDLRDRRKEFSDEAARLYLDDYERYRESATAGK
jgi:hypothetical protein